MKRSIQPMRRPAGFTLLEVLIAVSVFALVLAAVNTIFYAALRLRNQTTEAIDQAFPIHLAVETIKKDLAHLVPPGGTLSGQLQTDVTMQGQLGQSSPEFHTASGVIDSTSPWSEVQRVSYYVAESTNRLGGRDLYRLIDRNLLPTSQEVPVSQLLLSGVEHIYFGFLEDQTWRDTWDSSAEDAGLPSAIKVQIELEQATPNRNPLNGPAPIEFVVPIVSRSLTNQTAEAGE